MDTANDLLLHVHDKVYTIKEQLLFDVEKTFGQYVSLSDCYDALDTTFAALHKIVSKHSGIDISMATDVLSVALCNVEYKRNQDCLGRFQLDADDELKCYEIAKGIVNKRDQSDQQKIDLSKFSRLFLFFPGFTQVVKNNMHAFNLLSWVTPDTNEMDENNRSIYDFDDSLFIRQIVHDSMVIEDENSAALHWSENGHQVLMTYKNIYSDDIEFFCGSYGAWKNDEFILSGAFGFSTMDKSVHTMKEYFKENDFDEALPQQQYTLHMLNDFLSSLHNKKTELNAAVSRGVKPTFLCNAQKPNYY